MSITLSSGTAFAAAVATAHRVDLASYTLSAGRVRDALVRAAAGGTGVRIRLESNPVDGPAQGLHAANRTAIAVLAAAGADAALTPPGSPALHMKAAIVDGVAWLDDRNWAADERQTVIRDSDSADVAAVAAALDGAPPSDGPIRLTKGAAQQLEVDVIRSAGSAPLAVESESFGSGAVYPALLERARAGWPTRLIVAGREAAGSGPADGERSRLHKLASLGMAVRTGRAGGADLDDKLAISEHAAWIGSANATYARGVAGEQRDWGLSSSEAGIVDGLRGAFESNWRAAIPLASE